MKTILSIFAVLVLALPMRAQFVAGPVFQSALASSTLPLRLTNDSENPFPTTTTRVCTVGESGFGFFATIGSTNSLATTNGGFVVEFISDPNGSAAANSLLTTATLNLAPNGTSPYYYWTNVPSTIANVGNLRGVRLKYLTNGNKFSIWITNAYFVTR